MNITFNENDIISRKSEAWYKKDERVIIPTLFDIKLNITQSKIWEMFDGHNSIKNIMETFPSYSQDDIYDFIILCDKHGLIELVMEDEWEL
ncbi:MAG: hypothetical protein MR836_08910 [Ruminococcus sp.]|nr:hypothetical protein [Ruminococcus sp.]